MDANFDLRASICQISEGNHKLIEKGRKLGAHVKFAGSGGAIVGVYDGDPGRLEKLADSYAAMGAALLVPAIESRLTEVSV